ncbi:hypothetical protein Q5752_004669 [Cryptotrichosporon argae]
MVGSEHDPVTQAEHGAYHSSAYAAAGEAIMSFTPINQIHQQLCALHVYAHDPSRSVRAHHFCTHLRKDLHQCVVYDSDRKDARLIGVEYLVPESVFLTLPEEEKKYWHSHKFEVESGMLKLGTKTLVPNAVTDLAERPAMLELHRTYGKTTHTWQYDIHPELPLGPPQIMMSYTAEDQVDKALLRQLDDDLGIKSEDKRAIRAQYLRKEDMERPPAPGSDPWRDGKFGNLEWVEKKEA